MNEKVAKALSYVDEKYVAAAAKRKKKNRYWLGAVAAVLALVLIFNIPSIPFAISAKAVSIASDSRQTERPDLDDYTDRDEWRAELDKWQAAQTLQQETAKNALIGLTPFFTAGSAQFLEHTR